MELIVCPECGGTAEVEWRASQDSTDGPVELVKLRCIRRHWFLLPASDVPAMVGADGEQMQPAPGPGRGAGPTPGAAGPPVPGSRAVVPPVPSRSCPDGGRR